MLTDKLKAAMDGIHAESRLKEETVRFLQSEIQTRRQGQIQMESLVHAQTQTQHAQPNCRRTRLRSRIEQYADKQCAASRFVDDRLVDGRLVDGRLVDDRLVDGRFADGRFVDGRFADGRFVDGRFVDGRFADAQYTTARYKAAQYKAARRATARYTSRCNAVVRNAAVLASVFVLFLAGLLSHSLYYTPSAYVDVDVNPAIELILNRFDRVIGAYAYNNDGEEILNELSHSGFSLKHTHYKDALERLIDAIDQAGYIGDEGLVSVTLQAENSGKEPELLAAIQSGVVGYMSGHHHMAQVDVYPVSGDTRSSAHALQLTPAKYLAIQALIAVDPTADIENCRDHSISEIQQLTRTHNNHHGGGGSSGNENSNGSGNGNANGNEIGNGNGNSNGNSHGNDNSHHNGH